MTRMSSVALPPSRSALLERLVDGAVALRRPSGLVIVESRAGAGLSTTLRLFARRLVERGLVSASSIEHVAAVSWERDDAGALFAQVDSRAVHESPRATAALWRSTIGDDSATEGRRWDAVVIVDDAHDTDRTSIETLVSATRFADAPRVLVVLGLHGEAMADAVSAADLSERLNDITEADAAALAVSRGITMPSVRATELISRTGGSLRLAVELLEGVPTDEWYSAHFSIPAAPSVRARVGAAVADLSHAARETLFSVAVLAQVYRYPVAVRTDDAARLAGVDLEGRHLDELREARLLTSTDACDRRVRLWDDMTALAVSETMIVATRRALHERAASLTEDSATRLRHVWWSHPHASPEVAELLTAEAKVQALEGAWTCAGDLFHLASDATADRREAGELLVQAADALVGAGDVPAALALLPQVEAQRETAARDGLLGYMAIMRGRPHEAASYLNRAWDLALPQRNQALAATVAQRFVLHHLAAGRPVDLVTWADRAIAVDSQAPAAVEAQAIRGLGSAVSEGFDVALDRYRSLLEHSEEGPVRQRMLMASGWLKLAADDLEGARSDLETAVSAETSGSVRISAWARAWLARVQFLTGDWTSAVETATVGADIVRRNGLSFLVPLLEWTATQVHALRGDFEAAQEALRRGFAPSDGYALSRVPHALARAALSEARGDYEDVVRALAPLDQPWADAWIAAPGFWAWADVYVNALTVVGRLDDANDFLTAHEQRSSSHTSARARLLYARGRLLGAQGDLDSARPAFDEALALLEGLPLPYDRARVLFAYGQALRRAGKRSEASQVSLVARDAYNSLGARIYVQRCDRELAAGGLGSNKTDPDVLGLTAQERAVASVVASGATNKEAAARLFVSVKTVQYHLTRIYAKMGVRSRAELAAVWGDSDA